MEKEPVKNEIEISETEKTLKKDSTDKNPVQKGYNEKNPTQPQGAFTADSNPNDKKPTS